LPTSDPAAPNLNQNPVALFLIPPCTGCEYYTNTVSPQNQRYEPNSPGFHPFLAIAGTHRGWLLGPAGTDFNLLLFQQINGVWAVVASSTGSTSSEEVVFTGGAGNYVWTIRSALGTGTYDFWMERPGSVPPPAGAGAGAPGTSPPLVPPPQPIIPNTKKSPERRRMTL